jgi:hypothetical protein
MDLSDIDAKQWLDDEFPYLRDSSYDITSPYTDDYNCIAWAAGDLENWWWPEGDAYWPMNVPREHTLENFILAFRTLGFEPCDFSEQIEPEFEKVVIYVNDDLKPQHMAKQMDSGLWSSKLGRAWDIEHYTVQGVECPDYGRAKQMLKRRKR